jgi:hypothetical protein
MKQTTDPDRKAEIDGVGCIFLAYVAERRIVNGAFEVIAKAAELPANARYLVDSLAGQGHRVAA